MALSIAQQHQISELSQVFMQFTFTPFTEIIHALVEPIIRDITSKKQTWYTLE